MPIWEVRVEINSHGRIILNGPSEEAIKEVLNSTPKKKLSTHLRDTVSFFTIDHDSIRRIDEESDSTGASSPADGLLGNEQAAADGEQGRDDDLDGGDPNSEPVVVEGQHGGTDESGEPLGEVSPEAASQVARGVESEGTDSGLRCNSTQTDPDVQVQDRQATGEDEHSGSSGKSVRRVLPQVPEQATAEKAEAAETPEAGRSVSTEEEKEETEQE